MSHVAIIMIMVDIYINLCIYYSHYGTVQWMHYCMACHTLHT